MAKKRLPSSSNDFLAHVFKPKKNERPVGLRKTYVRSTSGERNARRVRAWNKLSAVNQEILNVTGRKEAYLRGDITLPEAKRILRPIADRRGITQPLPGKQEAVDAIVGAALQRPYHDKRRDVRIDAVERNVNRMSQRQLRAAREIRTHHDLMDLINDEDNETNGRNLFWYH